MAAMMMGEEVVVQGRCSRAWRRLKTEVLDAARTAMKLGKDDPRKIIHSLKVGLAITIVSLFYYYEPLFDGFGVAAMWAVMTVVVVFEFSVGATLGKGVNRGIATWLGGALGFGVHRLAVLSGETFEPILVALFVFLIAGVVTYARFLPKMKARYDYGLLIFILTFCLISVSGYRDDEVLEMTHQRLSTILIGGSISVIICVLICPVWAGDDLHYLVPDNIEKLASFLQGYGAEYFKDVGNLRPIGSKTSLLEYKSVLDSKATEESLANFAKWEPRHGRIRYRHPWGQYLKMGAITRQCAYNIEALNAYLNAEIQAPTEVRERICKSCMKMSIESGKALKELALSIRSMTTRSSAFLSHIRNAKTASEDLKALFRTTGWWQDADFLMVIPAATVVSLLIDIVTCTEKIAEAVHDLASLAKFTNNPIVVKSEPIMIARQDSLAKFTNILIAVNLEPLMLARQETLRPRPPIDTILHVSTAE